MIAPILWAVATGLVALILVLVVWKKLAEDAVGDVITPPTEAGVQGKVAFWLRENAPLRAPRPPHRPRKPGKVDPESPAGRAMAALMRGEMVRERLEAQDAYARLTRRAPSPVSRLFLDGRMRGATLAHARTIFRGPEALFWPWYLFIASVRYGRRRLYLDTVTHAVQELRT